MQNAKSMYRIVFTWKWPASVIFAVVALITLTACQTPQLQVDKVERVSSVTILIEQPSPAQLNEAAFRYGFSSSGMGNSLFLKRTFDRTASYLTANGLSASYGGVINSGSDIPNNVSTSHVLLLQPKRSAMMRHPSMGVTIAESDYELRLINNSGTKLVSWIVSQMHANFPTSESSDGVAETVYKVLEKHGFVAERKGAVTLPLIKY